MGYRQAFYVNTERKMMQWKVKQLFLASKSMEACVFDNGEMLSLDSLNLEKFPKLENLI